MPRTYKRAVGSRQYSNYSSENLAKCLDDIKERRLTQREAAKVYNIPRRTINYKLREKHMKSIGSPTVFTDQEENTFVKCIISMSDSGEFSEYDEEESTTPKSSKWKPIKKEVGEYVVFTYEGELFPGKIINIEKQVATISAMQRNGKLCKWPNTPDILDYPWQDVIGHAENPKQIGKRSIFSVPELDDVWGKI